MVILAGLILFAFLNARRQRLGETSEPVDLPQLGLADGVNGASGNDSGNGHAAVLSDADLVAPSLAAPTNERLS